MTALEGFSHLEMAISMPANLILVSWVATLAILAWPRDGWTQPSSFRSIPFLY